MYKSPRGRFQGPYCGGWGSRCIKELNRPVGLLRCIKKLNRPARAAPPITKLIRNQEATVRYIICARKSLVFQGPTPLPLANIMNLHASKTLRTGPYKS
jgi:hypothetical protein